MNALLRFTTEDLIDEVCERLNRLGNSDQAQAIMAAAQASKASNWVCHLPGSLGFQMGRGRSLNQLDVLDRALISEQYDLSKPEFLASRYEQVKR